MGYIVTKRFRVARAPLIAILTMLTITLGVIGVTVRLGIVQATPSSGVSVENFGQATLNPFHINQPPDFMIQSESETEVAIQKVTISPGGHTGWHTHPGPILAIVTEGQIKHTRFTEKGSCIERVFGPGESEQAFVEVPNQVHMARNKGEVDAVLYIARLNIPVGGKITGSSPRNPGC
jgi:quercetin dioxygenase-like cupin family protein